MGTLRILKKPGSKEEFEKYIFQKFKPTVGFGTKFEQNYILNQRTLLNEIKDSGFWNELLENLKEVDVKYRMENKDFNLVDVSKIEINIL